MTKKQKKQKRTKIKQAQKKWYRSRDKSQSIAQGCHYQMEPQKKSLKIRVKQFFNKLYCKVFKCDS
jgi:uncharacterized FlaG/YvyC family protein